MKISQKLELGFLAITLMIAATGWIAGHYQKVIIENNISNEIDNMKKTFIDIKEHDAQRLSAALEVFVQDYIFKEIYLERDRKALYDHGQILFRNLRNKFDVTHFYFILPNERCFVRLHNEELYGDKITRFTFWKARDTQKTAYGIELGKTAFAFWVIRPYYHKNKLIGYVGLGEGIDHFLKHLKGSTHNEFAIVAHKEYLEKEKWKTVRQTARLRNNWDDLKEHVIISDTI